MPAFLVHGNPDSARLWSRTIQHLGDYDGEIVAADLVGLEGELLGLGVDLFLALVGGGGVALLVAQLDELVLVGFELGLHGLGAVADLALEVLSLLVVLEDLDHVDQGHPGLQRSRRLRLHMAADVEGHAHEGHADRDDNRSLHGSPLLK